jgi:hypothetical protein
MLVIKVYDKAFSKSYSEWLGCFVKNSLYKMYQDNESIESSHHMCMHSMYDKEDVKNTGILEELKKHEAGKLVNFDKLQRGFVNLTFPGQTHIEHTHRNTDVILYYVNDVWNREWAGETMFYSDDNSELERAVEYVPNRVVFFNGEHPHVIRPPTFDATFYRFTVSLFFTRD